MEKLDANNPGGHNSVGGSLVIRILPAELTSKAHQSRAPQDGSPMAVEIYVANHGLDGPREQSELQSKRMSEVEKAYETILHFNQELRELYLESAQEKENLRKDKVDLQWTVGRHERQLQKQATEICELRENLRLLEKNKKELEQECRAHAASVRYQSYLTAYSPLKTGPTPAGTNLKEQNNHLSPLENTPSDCLGLEG